MAQVANAGANQVTLNNGQSVTAQQGGWYDGQQYWGGTLSQPGQINSQSNQSGAGQAVSQDVIAQTNPANVAYINQERQAAGLSPSPTTAGTALTAAPGQGGSGTGTGSLGGTFGAANAAINLPDLYNTLSNNAGISGMEKDITDKTTSFNTAQSQINDNPFLSEADRTGRIQKLTTDYNNDIANTQNALTMAKQDINTQIQLQTQQFDINSQQAQQALTEFNTLLSSGALAGASGSDIASITAATGISSTEVQAAIQAQTVKDTPTSVMTVDDGTNQYAVVMNTQTGQVISKSVLAPSKPVAASASATATQTAAGYTSAASQYAASGVDLQTLVQNFGVPGGLTIPQIYQIYNSYTPNGPAKETLQQAEQGIFANESGFTSSTQQAVVKKTALSSVNGLSF